jgi:hypothetical protein
MAKTLHLGELDQPYGNAGTAISTYEVGVILEAKYGLYSTFADMRSPQIASEIENSVVGALETMFMQRRPDIDRVRANAFKSAESKIGELFRDAIDQRIYDGRIHGVPTQAALKGVRSSWKRPYRRRGGRQGKVQPGAPRASFFDTGLLSSSFRAWVD